MNVPPVVIAPDELLEELLELLEELDQGEGAWELHNKRDFNAEIQNYLENKQLRAE